MPDKDKIIEQQNQAIEVLNNRLEMAETDKKKLEQENNRLELLLETEKSEHAKLKLKIGAVKGD
jgi:CDP-glycerol glycerophosphotransferase (TagB/SpsB family)